MSSAANTAARESLIATLKEIRGLAESVVEAMQNSERLSVEDAGIAFVCGEAIVNLVAPLELDLICDELAGAA